jgi:two-component sensor histidine kinase
VGEVTLTDGLSKSVREVRATSVSVIFLILCLAAFVGVFTYFLANVAAQTKSRLEDDAATTAQIVATNGFWMNQVAIQTLRRVDTLVDGDLSSIEGVAFNQLFDERPPEVIVSLIDADANLIYSTANFEEGVNLAERDYFQVLRNGAAFATSAKVITQPRGRVGFVFAKRLTRNNKFAGVITASYPNTVLESFVRDIDLIPGAAISLVRRDGRLMARYPTPDAPDLVGDALFTEHVQRRDAGTFFIDRSPTDSKPKIIAFRSIPGTEMIAIAALPTEPAWALYRTELISMLVIIAPVGVALVIVGFWIWRLLRRDAIHAEELETANETNTMLFREIHHRVKNNLQSVQSLVRLQDIPEAAKIDLQSRLGAMAAMHEHIYRRDEYEDIDAHDIVPVVINEVVRAYGKPVEIVYELDRCYVDRDHITPLSLLLSELVTNALKYAFPEGGEGRIRIILQDLYNGRCKLTVADNGVGMTTNIASSNSMGLRLIRGVVAQMGGTYEFVQSAGTRFEANIALSSVGHHAERR